MVEFKPGMRKEELLEVAAANGVAADDSMTKAQIIDVLNAHNAQETAGKPAEGATEGAESAAGGEGGAESAAGGEGGGDTTHGEKPAERPTEGAEGYDTFVYCGPSIPRGRLKENAVFRGTLADVLNYLADVIEDYPQIPRLIVPTNRLAAFAVKVKTPGNIAHKYYTDIVSAMKMKKNKEG